MKADPWKMKKNSESTKQIGLYLFELEPRQQFASGIC